MLKRKKLLLSCGFSVPGLLKCCWPVSAKLVTVDDRITPTASVPEHKSEQLQGKGPLDKLKNYLL